MDGLFFTLTQLVLLAASAGFAVLAASSARRAASFDVTRDFDALAHAVMKLQSVARSERMKVVRAAASQPEQAQPASLTQQPLTHEQLRALLRARRNGATQ